MDNGASSYRRFLEGDESGLADIIKTYNDGLTLYINSLVNNIALADELSEDTFVKLGLKKPRFSGRSSFKTWLYSIGHNVAVDHMRRASKMTAVPIDDCLEQADAENVENDYLAEENKRVLHRAMRRLKPEYRQVLWLVYFEGLSLKESAIIMKKSVRSVECLVSRARQSLRVELEEKENFHENF